MLSDLGERLTGHSGIHELMRDLGHALEDGGDLIMMGGGHPARIPELEGWIRGRVIRLLEKGDSIERMIGDYDSPIGNRRFRNVVAEFFRKHAGFDVGPENVAITSGSQSAFFLLFNLLGGMTRGVQRRILLPLAPEYIGYADQGLEPNLFAALRAKIEPRGERRFKYRIDFEAVARAENVAAICLSRPTNPSGNYICDDDVARLIGEAERHDCPLMIDNAYGLPFPGTVFHAAKPFWNPRVIACYSLSKLGMPGTRTGIIVAAPNIVQRLEVANAVLMLSNSNSGPVMAAELFESGEIAEISRRIIRPYYEERSRLALSLLERHMPAAVPWRVHESEGAFFLWLWLPGLPGGDRELYRRLKSAGMLAVPGHWFFNGLDSPWEHSHECLRLSYCLPPAKLEQGMKILGEVVADMFGVARVKPE